MPARPTPTGAIIAAGANAVAVFAFFVLPYGAASSSGGPQTASSLSQSAAAECTVSSSNPAMGTVCSFLNTQPPVIWGLGILAVVGLVAAIVALASPTRPRAASITVLLGGILGLLGYAYSYIALQSVFQALEQAGGVINPNSGYGSGFWIMLVAAPVAIVGAFIQLGSKRA
jgi:hypothetical protein